MVEIPRFSKKVTGWSVTAIKTYQVVISSISFPHCRFYPTCSHYAIEAIEKHGAVRGSWLAFKRVLSCHPFHPGGVDLVPEPEEQRDPAR